MNCHATPICGDGNTDPTLSLAEHASSVRNMILDSLTRTRSSHIGSAYSVVDVLVSLYFDVTHSVASPNPNRDIILLSKGHAVVAQYAVLVELGMIPRADFSYAQDGTPFTEHPTWGELPGIEATSGSLGHGLGVGCGLALGKKLQSLGGQVFVIAGDGECNEGSMWEALLFAEHHELSNLTLIIDHNGLQGLGRVESESGLTDLQAKLEAFHWHTRVVNGHSFSELHDALTTHGAGPIAVIANTVKGKGVSFMENRFEWHYKSPSEVEFNIAKRELSGL